jgi:DNA replication ATP-dependent helicase Dna2
VAFAEVNVLQTGDLVKDWRRMNVSFTRARSKLVIFGSRQTLQATPLLKEFFGLMDEKGWVLNILDGAHTLHASVLRDDAQPPVVNQGRPMKIEDSVEVIDLTAAANQTAQRKTDDDTVEVIDLTEEDDAAGLKVTPSKRRGEEKENVDGGGGSGFEKDRKDARPVKKMRKSRGVDSGIVMGKPMLLDLINDAL